MTPTPMTPEQVCETINLLYGTRSQEGWWVGFRVGALAATAFICMLQWVLWYLT